MNVRRLALISTMTLGLALAGNAFAQEQDQQHETHHEDTGAPTAPEAQGESMGGSADDAAAASGMPAGAASSGMMMCQPMMAQMMGKGSMMSRMDMMGQGKSGRGMMGKAMMGTDGTPMAHAGLPKLISVEAIKGQIEKMITDNKRLKVGKLEPGGDFVLSAEITTVDGSLVHKLLIDRRNGTAYEVE